jgi:tetratricopeptide (TPR) repeat protein/tRNA A-37 threonylcarbamoyl transferase component Bud32
MTGHESCPDCGARLPAISPAGLCPLCLLRLGAALSADPAGGFGSGASTGVPERTHGEAEAFPKPAAASTMDGMIGSVVRIHLGDTPDAARLVRSGAPEMPDLSDQPSRYQLVGELARGGMGEIFQGRDLDLGRDLAVKVIREEHRDHPEMVRRFVEEAQIGGQLQHPGITPVHELGRFPDGRLFIAMKLVRGRTLAALLGARRSPDEDRMQFLSVFEQVCQAMAYAHSRRVIHRDLKPSNVMVGAFGEVQVMDWGLAKVLDQEGTADEEKAPRTSDGASAVRTLRCGSEGMESRFGSVLGTPSYMAPEQARGALDTLDERADVFALGSILCEILTGQPAFAGGSEAEVYRKAERADLSDALARLDACNADAELAALARACLAAAPKDRPRDAGMVVAGLTAYLRGVEKRLREAELAQARAETRAAGERRRRLLTVALAASMLATGLIGVAGWGWTDHERQRREDALRAAVDAALADSAKKSERARAGGGDPVPWVEAIEAARRAESLLGGNEVSAGLRERVQAFLADLIRERDAAESAEKDRRIVERLAAIHNDLGVHNDEAKADAEYAAAFRAYGVDLDGLDPEAAGRSLAASPAAADLANALDQWAILRRGRVLRNPGGAARLVAAARAADPDPWRNRLRDTLGRMEGGPAHRLEVLERLAATADVDRLPVASVTRLATSLAFLGRRDTAVTLLRRAQASHRDDFWVNADLGRELLASARFDEAVRFFAVATGVRPGSRLALSGLGKALLLSGQPAEAADIFRELTRLRPDDALARVALGSSLLALGQPQEAEAEFREAKRLKPDDWMVRDQIAIAFSDRGDWAAAVEEQRESVRRFPGLAVVHKALAHALQSAGRIEEAIAEFREAVRLNPRFSSAYLFLGRVLIEAGDYRAALDALARVDVGPPPPDPVLSPSTLASRAEHLLALEPRLPAVVEGCDLPADAEECVEFARLAFARRAYAAAAHLWTEAFTASPALAADLVSGNRFQAARAAALAGAGDGKGQRESSPEADSPTRWRAQAVAWLEADLAASAAALETGRFPQRAAVNKRLSRWQVEPALAGLRDEPAVAGLPESERRSLHDLWRRIAALRAKAAAPPAHRAGGNP